jgi:hypothetical protein
VEGKGRAGKGAHRLQRGHVTRCRGPSWLRRGGHDVQEGAGPQARRPWAHGSNSQVHSHRRRHARVQVRRSSSSSSSSGLPAGGAAGVGGRRGMGLLSAEQPRRQASSSAGLAHARRLAALCIPEGGERSSQGGQRHVAVQLAEGPLPAAHTRRRLAAAALAGAGCHGAAVRAYLTPMANGAREASPGDKKAGICTVTPLLGPFAASVYPD